MCYFLLALWLPTMSFDSFVALLVFKCMNFYATILICVFLVSILVDANIYRSICNNF